MKYYNNILETIGNTPLVKLNSVNKTDALVLAKVESFNPGHSTKDRMALKMIEDAEKNGIISKGATITLPQLPEGSYMSMQPVTEDHRPQPMSYGAGTYELATHTGDHMIVIIRLDSNFSPEQAKKYQHQLHISRIYKN